MPKFITTRQFLHVEDVLHKALECPVCEFCLRDSDDQKSYDEKGACTECVGQYYYQNAEEWNKGWRPEKKK